MALALVGYVAMAADNQATQPCCSTRTILATIGEGH